MIESEFIFIIANVTPPPPNSNSLVMQLYEKSGCEIRNRFIISVDQIGLEPMTSRL